MKKGMYEFDAKKWDEFLDNSGNVIGMWERALNLLEQVERFNKDYSFSPYHLCLKDDIALLDEKTIKETISRWKRELYK
jgi:hypothetical protein